MSQTEPSPAPTNVTSSPAGGPLRAVIRGARSGEVNRPSLDKMLAKLDKLEQRPAGAVQPSSDAPPRTRFDGASPDKVPGLMRVPIWQRLRFAWRALPLFWRLHRTKRLNNRAVRAKTEQRPITSQSAAALQATARSLGARDIAFIRVPPQAVFRDTVAPARYGIVYTVEMDPEPMATAPSLECQLEVVSGYRALARVAEALTKQLRGQGFGAWAGLALGGSTDYVQMGELAGLGAIGYHGLLITPGEGARVRIGVVYTDAEGLPLVEPEQNQHLWVREFCDLCRRCIRECPPKAIRRQPEPRGAGGMQAIDHDKCRDYFTENFGCAVCLAECPFSGKGYEAIHERFRGNPRAPRLRIVY